MPRIAATLGSFLLMAIAIGVNTARYPIVGQMVSSSGVAPGSEEARREPVAPPAPVETASASPVPAPPAMKATEEVVAASPPSLPPSPLPLPANAAAREAVPTVNAPAEAQELDRSEPVGRIVAVRPVSIDAFNMARPDSAPSGTFTMTRQEPAPLPEETSPGVERLRRLPPLDRLTPAENRSETALPESVLPVYPTTDTP